MQLGGVVGLGARRRAEEQKIDTGHQNSKVCGSGQELAKRARMRSCGRRSAAARPAAPRARGSRAASPALRPGLTGTRRRKRRRGPFGPEVDQSSCEAATPSNLRQENPFARGAAPPDRHPTQRRRSTSSARPQARRAADICARSGGCGERALNGARHPSRIIAAAPAQPRRTAPRAARSLTPGLPQSFPKLPRPRHAYCSCGCGARSTFWSTDIQAKPGQLTASHPVVCRPCAGGWRRAQGETASATAVAAARRGSSKHSAIASSAVRGVYP